MDVSNDEIDGRIQALVQQRNAAQDNAVLLAGLLNEALKKIEKLEKQEQKDE